MSVPSSENPQGATLGDFTIKGHKQPGLYGEVSVGGFVYCGVQSSHYNLYSMEVSPIQMMQ